MPTAGSAFFLDILWCGCVMTFTNWNKTNCQYWGYDIRKLKFNGMTATLVIWDSGKQTEKSQPKKNGTDFLKKYAK